MFEFLRSNRPSFLIVSPLVALACSLGAFWLTDVPYQEVGWTFFDDLFRANGWMKAFLLATLIGLQGFVLYRVCVVGSFFQQNTQLPALIWCLVAGAITILHTDFKLQVAILLALFSALRIVRVYRQNRILYLAFESGFWAGTAILLEPGLILLCFSLMLSLAYARTFHWREWAVLILGLLSPVYIWLGLSFVILGQMPSYAISWAGFEFLEVRHLHAAFWIVLLIVGVGIGLLAYLRSYAEDSNQTRNAKNHMAFFALALLVGMSWFAADNLHKHYESALVSLAIFSPFIFFVPRRLGAFLSTVLLISVGMFCGFVLFNGFFV